jgi:hypothetical protein
MNVLNATQDEMSKRHTSDSCRGMTDLIVGYFLSDLNSSDESRVRQHLECCESCCQRLTAIENAWETV